MKRLKRRLFLHFSLQFILVAISMIILLIIISLILINVTTNRESQLNYFQTKINYIAEDTEFSSVNKVKMTEDWDKDFSEDQIWVQVINHKGSVIQSSNAPNNIPTQYSQRDLLNIQQTKEFQEYSIYYYIETLYETPYLFVLGHKDEGKTLLRHLVEEYGKDGVVAKKHLSEVEKELQNINGSLNIYDTDETVQQTLGKNLEHDEWLPLDMFIRERAPDSYTTKITTYKNPDTQHIWVLYTPNKNKKELKLDSINDILPALETTGAITLLITIIISFWNGFRYGNPLFIFTSWLGEGTVSTKSTNRKRRKLIFRKNGKIRLKNINYMRRSFMPFMRWQKSWRLQLKKENA